MTDVTMMTGEDVVFSTRKHWLSLIFDSGWAILMVLGALILAWLGTDQTAGIMGFVNRVLNLGEIALVLGGLGWIAYNFVAWRSAEFSVTNMRVLGHDGLLRRRSTDTLLSSVADVRTRVTAIGRMAGFGDIEIFSASGRAGADRFRSVRDVDDFKKQILEQKMAAAGAPKAAEPAAAGTAAAAAAGAAQADAMKTLEDLGRLRDSGVITPEEFEVKKAELLSRI
jgi:Bacterial PH domain/Short C-terminal domain